MRDNETVSLAPPAHSPITAGYKLDRYELICPIAEGGMASVWIARQTGKHGFQKLVAVKTMLPKYAEDPAFQHMFIDEARIASRIEHANVTQILDVGEQHGVTYLVMEYVDGDALSKISRAARKKNVKIPLGVLLRIVADVCGGLHAAHELRDDKGRPLGVVHRDVSPQNVLVTTRGVAKLIDFGIAKARDRLSGDTNADTLKGKVQYMAPEQALGKAVDRRADVYAVGAVLYHLIAGKPPFEAENDIQTLFLVTSGRPPRAVAARHPRGGAGAGQAGSRPFARGSLRHGGRAPAGDRGGDRRGEARGEPRGGVGVPRGHGGRSDGEAEGGDRARPEGCRGAGEGRRDHALQHRQDRRDLGHQQAARRRALHVVGDLPPRLGPAVRAHDVGDGADARLGGHGPPPEAGSRGLRFAIVGGVVGASVAVLALVALTRGRATPSPAAARPMPPAVAATAPALPAAPLAKSAAASAASAPPPPADSASAAPSAAEPPVAAPPPRWTPPITVARPTATSAPKPATAVPTRVNDGF